MAKFKCKQSGNIFEFVHDHDIKNMRIHPDYMEVIDNDPPLQTEGTSEQVQTKRSVGRPKHKE